MTSNAKQPAVEGDLTIPVHQEQVDVSIRTVDTGRGVRVTTSVTEHPFEVGETLHRDDVGISRVAVGQFVTGTDVPAPRYEGDTYIIPIIEEVLVVERRLRIKEEVHITKVKREDRHTETVFLKAEEVRVERFDDASDT
ncbi:YsnF/AvaK domain-containing protein [Massilia sp. TWR1-2-2]|uniref:YsnF/AvaK domain-containing protein n=1 Tax=Massilia sp. TWR1-2-2 TaxID=2804584 RepID=UPI003CEFDDA1